MTPSAWRDGRRGEVIRWAVVDSRLGCMLVAATACGVCRLSFGEGEAELRAWFPHAALEPASEDEAALFAYAAAVVDAPGRAHDLPLDVAGTAIQQAV